MGRPKKYKKEQVDRMVQLLEEGLETTVPDVVSKKDAVRAAAGQNLGLPAPKKCSGVEVMDSDGCCVLCGGGAADLLCTFPCPSSCTEADDGGVVSVCGCMYVPRRSIVDAAVV
jgi:hypothetical protein